MPKFIYSQDEFDTITKDIDKVMIEKNKIIKTLCNKLVGHKSKIKAQAKVNVKIPAVDISCIYNYHKPLNSYILTEEEHKKLLSLEHRVVYDKNRTISDLCMQIANTIPMISKSDISRKEVILGCIRNDVHNNHELVNPTWCDDCPLCETCEHEYKEFKDFSDTLYDGE